MTDSALSILFAEKVCRCVRKIKNLFTILIRKMTRYNDDISCSAVLARVFVSSDTMDIMTNKKRIILGIFACCEMEILFSTRTATIV